MTVRHHWVKDELATRAGYVGIAHEIGAIEGWAPDHAGLEAPR